MEELKVLQVGHKVPDFEMETYLPDKKDFGKIKFSDVFKQGKWLILVFYPADFTFVCPTELADIGDKYQELKKEGAELVTVSTDTNFVHMAWHGSEKLLSGIKYPMGADPTHIVSKAFGVYDAASGMALRGTFLIDPDGIVQLHHVGEGPADRPGVEMILQIIDEWHPEGKP